MSNKFIGTEKVVDAAMSLASLSALHKKPILFDMQIYADLLIGSVESNPAKLLAKYLDKPIDQETLKRLQRELTDHLTKAHHSILEHYEFVEALRDAFTLKKVIAVRDCLLCEIGYTSYTSGWLFMVVPTPAPVDCFVLDL